MNTRARIKAIPALLAAGAFASLPGAIGALAQDSTPDAAPISDAWKDLDLPEIHLEVMKDAIEGMPTELEAGRYRVLVHGEPTPEDFVYGPMFGNLPDGLTVDDILDQAAASTDGIIPAFYEITMPGGPMIYAPTGETSAVGIVEFTAGDWFVAGYALAQPPVTFTVTGETPADQPEPESTITFTIGEMTIDITEGELTVGQNLVRVDNIGAQPHFVEIQKAPDGTTNEDIAKFLESMMGGTPDPDGIAFEDLGPVAFLSDQSGGTTQWAAINVNEPGTHLGICFVPDPETGAPHAMMGMYTVFEVKA